MKRTIMALAFAAAAAPPEIQATEIPTEAAFERPFLCAQQQRSSHAEYS
jgi:hypothetical protein